MEEHPEMFPNEVFCSVGREFVDLIKGSIEHIFGYNEPIKQNPISLD